MQIVIKVLIWDVDVDLHHYKFKYQINMDGEMHSKGTVEDTHDMIDDLMEMEQLLNEGLAVKKVLETI